MYFIPFVYFAALTIYLWYKSKNFDVAVYMSLLYTLTSACCVIMVLGDMLEGSGVLYNGFEPELGLLPTILYCGLLTMTIIPFYFVKAEILEKIDNSHPKLLLLFSAILVAQFLLNTYLVADSTISVLNGDLNDVREAHYNDEMSLADVKAASMPYILRLFNYLNYTTILALPLFFYYTCMEKRSIWLTSCLLLASLSGPLKAIQAVDRAELILYAEMFLFCVILFKKHLTSGLKKLFVYAGVPFVALGIVYLTAVSMARFDKTDEGASGSVLQYAGQSYLNFCYFYDNADPNLIYTQREIPVISHVFLNTSYGEVKEERSAREGFFIGVFATHVGAWLLDVGVVGAVVLSLLFCLACLCVVKYRERTVYDIADVLMIFIFATVPIFGIFYYRFHGFYIALQYVFAGIIYVLSKFEFKWSKKKSSTQ